MAGPVAHPLGPLALLHPFPSVLNAVVVAALATLAGASVPVVTGLSLSMLGFQVSIGALNDLVDAAEDARSRPAKPIPAGLVRPRTARAVVVVGAIVGVVGATLGSGPAVLLGVAGYGCGVSYDLWLKRRGLGPLAFAVAFPLLLLFAWTGATGEAPPGWPTLLPVAALAGPALQLSNALTDLDHDRASGIDGLAIRLGRRRAVGVLIVLVVAVYGLAWWTLRSLPGVTAGSVALTLVATIGAVIGLVLTARGDERASGLGWALQAIGIATLAVAWVASAV